MDEYFQRTDSTGTAQYFWDFENRMTSVTLPGSGGTVTFKYDPFGRRIYKSSTAGTGVYAYDGDNLVEETNATGAVVPRYEQTQTSMSNQMGFMTIEESDTHPSLV